MYFIPLAKLRSKKRTGLKKSEEIIKNREKSSNFRDFLYFSEELATLIKTHVFVGMQRYRSPLHTYVFDRLLKSVIHTRKQMVLKIM